MILCIFSRILDGYLCILGHSGCQSNSFRQLTSGLISSIADACQPLGLSLNAGIGTIVQDFWNLNHSYKSAVHALEYRFFFPHQNIFDGREALGSDLSVADFSDTKEDELIRLLCKKGYRCHRSLVSEFFRLAHSEISHKEFRFHTDLFSSWPDPEIFL